MGAPEKAVALPTDSSSLLSHHSELFKARTLRALTGSKYIARAADCSKKAPAIGVATTATSDNDNDSLKLPALIDIAKAKIHRCLTAPEQIGCIDSSSTSSTVKKKAKKVAVAKMESLAL